MVEQKTEEQKFLEALLEAPPENLMPTAAEDAEFAAIWDKHQKAVAAQEAEMQGRNERFVG